MSNATDPTTGRVMPRIGDRIENEDGQIVTVIDVTDRHSFILLDATGAFQSEWSAEEIWDRLESGAWTTVTVIRGSSMPGSHL